MKNIKTILNITFLIAIISLILMFGINAERLPPISSDPNDWGTILNNYLLREHTGNGTHGNMTAQSLNVSGAVNLATSSGNVGIGTTAPADKLHLSDGALRISGNNSKGISLNVSNVLYVNVNASRVGIGTTAPDKKLHVVGDVRVQDGNIYVTKPVAAGTYFISFRDGSLIVGYDFVNTYGYLDTLSTDK